MAPRPGDRLCLSRRKSATTAGTPADQVRVCLVAAPPASVTLPALWACSGRLRDGRCGGEGPVVAQEGPQHTGAASCEGDDGLDVFAAFAAFLEVVVPVGAVADDAGLRGEVDDSAQAAAVALGAVQVAGAAAGVAGG